MSGALTSNASMLNPKDFGPDIILIKFRNRAKGRLSNNERRPFALYFTVFCKPVYGSGKGYK